MSAHELFSWTAALLFALGLYGVIAQRHLLRKVISLNIIGGGVFLFLISTAAREADIPPDPVPHAMVLTGIVVAVSSTAFALALVRKIHRQTGEAHLERAKPQASEGEMAE